ncbi:hypothetical protein Pmani_003811 [Petrolisthes manimaculis]|uniref:Uncharacterized protein n=1 Tax=Petrolisthes manimaculis TaxID=1843537 RepID=A0AAE1QFH7_9EUCA|nr:hypothetical protein Pmani_003811 [Petrolisthes manimaculis]
MDESELGRDKEGVERPQAWDQAGPSSPPDPRLLPITSCTLLAPLPLPCPPAHYPSLAHSLSIPIFHAIFIVHLLCLSS